MAAHTEQNIVFYTKSVRVADDFFLFVKYSCMYYLNNEYKKYHT